MIRFDLDAREATLSARDLIRFDASKALRPEPALGLRARAGTRVHGKRRAEAEAARGDSYRAERSVEYRVERRGWRATVQGRIDGLYREDGAWVVEEVKSVVLDPSRFAPEDLARAVIQEGAFADHRLQLEMYILFLADALVREGPADAGPPRVTGRLVLVNLGGGADPGGDGERAAADPGSREAAIDISPDLDAVRSWVHGRIDLVLDRAEAEEASRSARREAAARIAFPFPSLRPHQGDLAELVRATLEAGENLLASAPTGVGKTAAVLREALRFALERGLRIFWATSRTTGARIVVETLERIAAASGWNGLGGGPPPFRAVVLRAREKVCPRAARGEPVFCHEAFCPWAESYAEKVEGGKLVDRLLAGPVATPEAAVALGAESGACPYELLLDASLGADVSIGDYNYVFDPRSYLRPLFDERLARDAVLVVDEAHNLPARGRASYSPAVERRDGARLDRWAREREDEGVRSWCRRLEGLLAAASEHGREELGDPPVYPVDIDPAIVRSLTEDLDALRTRRLLGGSRGTGSPGGADPLEEFASRWGSFAAAFDAREAMASLVLYDKSGAAGHRLRVLCFDPSGPVGKRIAAFRSSILFSATLEPLEFHRDVIGLPPARTRLASFPSPFPEENRKILVWDRISTYFRSRGRDAAEVARLIEEIASVEPGNYLACFSSYAYLREVQEHMSPWMREAAVVQTPGMTEEARDLVLGKLREHAGGRGPPRTVLAVQGGIFTEGVDYPGKMLVGVIVVGPGLPAVTFDEERVREHFEDRFDQGFEYAYLYPGMSRAVQCAGRAIRSETDIAAIVLLGERFARSQYARLFPQHWYRRSPKELVSKDLVTDLREFWAGVHARADRRDG
jgi:DNA excision repair protein ERCC-2